MADWGGLFNSVTQLSNAASSVYTAQAKLEEAKKQNQPAYMPQTASSLPEKSDAGKWVVGGAAALLLLLVVVAVKR
jgi:hypothetical protein